MTPTDPQSRPTAEQSQADPSAPEHRTARPSTDQSNAHPSPGSDDMPTARKRPAEALSPTPLAKSRPKARSVSSPKPGPSGPPHTPHRRRQKGMTQPSLVKPATPGKGRYNAAHTTSTKRGSATQTLNTFLYPELIPFAKASTDTADFGARMPYIMSALFLYAREFNTDELRSIFRGIVPNGVDSDDLKEYRQLFDNAYEEYIHHFLTKVEFYTKQYLDSAAGKSWVANRKESK